MKYRLISADGLKTEVFNDIPTPIPGFIRYYVPGSIDATFSQRLTGRGRCYKLIGQDSKGVHEYREYADLSAADLHPLLNGKAMTR